MARETSTRRTSLRGEEEDPELTYEWFQKAITEDSKKLYNDIIAAIALREELRGQHDELLTEHHQLQQDTQEQIDMLIEERNHYRDVCQRLLRQDTPLADRPQKSTKLPDGAVLTDGKSPPFEHWLTRVRGKLRQNADHYPTDDAKIQYVVSMVDGEAAGYIAPRLREDSIDPFLTLDDILEHLTAVYDDPNRVLNAKDEFRKLYMKKQDTFHSFYSNFTRLATESQAPQGELKYELNHKLTFDLQKQVVREFADPTCTLKQFADHCAIIYQTWKGIEERQSRFSRTQEKTIRKPTTSWSPATVVNTPSTRTSNTASQQPSSSDRRQLQLEGRCFYCKGVGHRVFECAKKQQDQAHVEMKRLEPSSVEQADSENEKP